MIYGTRTKRTMDKTDQTKRTTSQDKTDHVPGQNGLKKHLLYNFNSNVFIDQMVWYVPCMVRFVLKRGPFCP